MRRLAATATLVLAGIVFPAAVATAQVPAHKPAATVLPSVTLPPALDRVLRDYEEAWQGKDPAALAKLFTEDGMTLSNGKAWQRGRANIEKGYAGAGGALSLRAVSYAVGDTVGYIIGGFALRPGAADAGKFVLALRRSRDGAWRIAADIDNSNEPRRPAPAP
jgi:ketosteroid isomerase-like protein